MKSNKEYRKYSNIEDSLNKISDIIDICDECKDNFRYVKNIAETKNNLEQIKKITDEIMFLISIFEKESGSNV